MRGRNHERMPLRGEAPKHAPVHQAPQMWRVPVGPGCGAGGRWQGLAGLRDDAPSEARGADGSRAGRRPPAHKAARPHSKVRRCPERQRCCKQRRGRAAAHLHTKQPGPTARCDGARNASGAASNVAGGPLPTDTPDSPAPQQGTTVPRTGAVPGVPAERRSNGNQSACPASSVARCTPLRPASCAAWVRHENPSARYTASGCADRDGSSE